VNKIILGILVGIAFGAAATYMLFPRREVAEESKKEEAKEESFVRHGTNGETILQLNKETQARMGLKTAPLAAVQFKPEVKGFGRVLDPTPLAALLVERAAAVAALEASTKELERLKLLAQSQNAAPRAIEIAEAAMKRDRIALDSVQPRLLLGWGKTVASLPDLPALVNSLAASEAVLVRVDLPLGESLQTPPTGGRIGPLNAPDKLANAQFLGAAPAADPQMQAQGFLFLQKANPLPLGAAVVAWLTVPGEAEAGVIVPREALIRHEGEVFVYIQAGDDKFARTEIELERPSDAGWFVHDGLKPQDKVVTVGAQQLLSEELKGQFGGE
jgi:hypothetical protein